MKLKLNKIKSNYIKILSNCWAFSAIGSIEGAIMKKYNKTVHLSVQQLTDCSSDLNYGNDGCKGGNVWNAYRYIYENGIIEESAYSFYSGKTGIQVKLYFNI
jgi:C1A family cysteine protease